jgi:hypothetical protein
MLSVLPPMTAKRAWMRSWKNGKQFSRIDKNTPFPVVGAK